MPALCKQKTPAISAPQIAAALALLIGTASSTSPGNAAPGDIQVPFRPYDHLDRATQSWIEIDGTIERRDQVEAAVVALTPNGPDFLFVHRIASGWCGSGGCALDIFRWNARGMRYELFQSFLIGQAVAIRPKPYNGMFPLVFDNKVWVWNGKEYTLP
jgi:hypothetical protein